MKSVIVLLLILGVSSKFLEKNLLSAVNEIITTIRTDNETDFRNALEIMEEQGGIILINTPILTIKEKITIKGVKEGGILGLQQPNDDFPIFEFIGQEVDSSNFRNGAIEVYASNIYIKDIIVEKSSGAGIYVKGANNTLNHIISRYNNYSGFLIDSGADNTILTYCYSYRNFGEKTYGKGGDGFTIYDGKNIVFNYCFAWDNSDRGFRAGESRFNVSAESVSFKHSASWNNGNFDVFTGKYDYDNAKSLDKNLWIVRDLIKSIPKFEDNYKSKKYNLTGGVIKGEDVQSFIVKAHGYMTGDGFEVADEINGNENKRTIRNIDYCASFDHKNKGFSKKNNVRFSGEITNNVGFNNNYNYYLSYYVYDAWSNNWSWEAAKGNQIVLGINFKVPAKPSSSQRSFYSIRNSIIKLTSINQFPGDTVNFDTAIKNLNELE